MTKTLAAIRQRMVHGRLRDAWWFEIDGETFPKPLSLREVESEMRVRSGSDAFVINIDEADSDSAEWVQVTMTGLVRPGSTRPPVNSRTPSRPSGEASGSSQAAAPAPQQAAPVLPPNLAFQEDIAPLEARIARMESLQLQMLETLQILQKTIAGMVASQAVSNSRKGPEDPDSIAEKARELQQAREEIRKMRASLQDNSVRMVI